jgi:FkbM family methyltransferase
MRSTPIARLRRLAHRVVQHALWTLAASRLGVALLNRGYRRMSPRLRAASQTRFAKIFRDGGHRLARATWVVDFAGREVAIALRPESAWLDWDAALSMLGHEPAIKETYETLLTGEQRPELFVDIGTNYGTHSLLFLVAGVPALSFEPNSSCHQYFVDACRLNAVGPRLEHAALGERTGEVEIFFPERETWLGSLNPRVIETLRDRPGVRSERVGMRRLDRYLGELAGRRVLVKIDAEDHELAVLAGAERVLAEVRPMVIFEAHRGNARAALFDFFDQRGFRIAHLPLGRGGGPKLPTREEFEHHPSDDFIALPVEVLAELDAGRASHHERAAVPVPA